MPILIDTDPPPHHAKHADEVNPVNQVNHQNDINHGPVMQITCPKKSSPCTLDLQVAWRLGFPALIGLGSEGAETCVGAGCFANQQGG